MLKSIHKKKLDRTIFELEKSLTDAHIVRLGINVHKEFPEAVWLRFHCEKGQTEPHRVVLLDADMDPLFTYNHGELAKDKFSLNMAETFAGLMLSHLSDYDKKHINLTLLRSWRSGRPLPLS